MIQTASDANEQQDEQDEQDEHERAPHPSLLRVLRRKPLAVLKLLGPGLIAGASDNDTTTVAAVAVVG